MGINPTIAAARPVDPVLQGIVSGLANASDEYIADQISRMIGAMRRPSMEVGGTQAFSGTIQRFAPAAWFGRPADRGAVGWGVEATKVVGVQLDPMTYLARKYFYQNQIAREKLALTAEAAGGYGAAQQTFGLAPAVEALVIEREATYANLFFTAANWLAGNNLAIPGGAEWDTAAGDPIGDITGVIRAINLAGGPVDGCILGADTAYALSVSNAFNNFRSTNEDRSNMSFDMVISTLKARFGFKEVLIGRARANTSNADAAGTLTNAFQWGDSMFIGKFSDVSMSNGANVTVRSQCAVSIIPEDLMPDEEYDTKTQSYVYTASMHEALSVVHNRLGGLITNCAA
jgi:hypothetical protein